ncbi:MAG: 30S ribosomal protein S4, partial [Candidatus Diapherotrites archaeon]|nr:30S ribosomal protein S4 [Candidatus Diapherotrites archaeon]
MGGIRKSRKKYDNPRKRWDKTRIEEEKDLTKTYGIK